MKDLELNESKFRTGNYNDINIAGCKLALWQKPNHTVADFYNMWTLPNVIFLY